MNDLPSEAVPHRQVEQLATNDWHKFAQERRLEFPIFERHPSLSYLDSAATAQKPKSVIDVFSNFWNYECAPIHRGVYKLSADATKRYEATREHVRAFLNARFSSEVVYCRGTTEAINLVAHSFVAPHLAPGDNVVISAFEHHANFVPWQQLCQRQGAELRIIPLKTQEIAGRYRSHLQCSLDLDMAEKLIDERSRILAISQLSNALGTILPVTELCKLAKSKGVPVLIDGAQGVVHLSADVQALDCDFYVFSGHKLYGPDGIGILYGKREHLAGMPPYQTGGDMIHLVTPEEVTFAPPPQRFEAGTMPVAGVIALHEAISYVQQQDHKLMHQQEVGLVQAACEKLSNSPELQRIRLIGYEEDSSRKGAIIGFTVDGIHPHDVASILDSNEVAVRAGHHCAQPLLKNLGLTAITRASFAMYNNLKDLDNLCLGLEKVIKVMT